MAYVNLDYNKKAKNPHESGLVIGSGW